MGLCPYEKRMAGGRAEGKWGNGKKEKEKEEGVRKQGRRVGFKN
jgi:hypothetical protein